MPADLFVVFCFAVGDHLAEIFRLAFLEPEELHERFNAFGGNVALALQNLEKQARVHVDRRSKHSITERGIQRFFEFIELLQELAVVRIVENVDFVPCKHRRPTIAKNTLFNINIHSFSGNIHFFYGSVDIFVHTI